MKYKIIIGLLILVVVVSGCKEKFEGEINTEIVTLNLTCRNSTTNLYHGKVNGTCYFFNCKDECEEREIFKCFEYRMFGEIDNICVWSYVRCVEECIEDTGRYYFMDDVDYGNSIERVYAHDWNCIIDETIQNITRKVCY